MKRGITPIAVLAGLFLIIIIGGSGYVAARNLTKFEKPRKFESLSQKDIFSQIKKPSPLVSIQPQATILPSPTQTVASSPSPSPSANPPLTYTQPQGKYKLTIPGDWVVNTTTATKTYSTTKFTGPHGYVTITFGTGKDPIGGCSEKSTIVLADRTIDGCYLLQKDGSQILTRTYTKDAAGIEFTIEAYINPALATNKPVILNIITTIDIE